MASSNRKWIAVLLLLRVAGAAHAAPFLVADVNSGTDSGLSSDPRNIIAAESLVYFTASSSLGSRVLPQQWWRTDGTIEGTFVVSDIPIRENFSLQVTNAVTIGDRLFFLLNSNELWVTDGTLESTRLLRTFYSAFTSRMVEFGGWLFVIGQDSASGTELWRSDGTPEGTQLVVDLAAGSNSGVRNGLLHASANGVYFTGGGPDDRATGVELWITDGSAEGTRMVADLWPGPNGSYPEGFVEVGGRTLFQTRGEFGSSTLWSTQGTPESTIALTDVRAQYLTSAGDFAIFFVSNPATGREPWVTDGTPEGTAPLGARNPGAVPSLRCFSTCTGLVVAAGNQVFYAAETAESGNELVVTDGTIDGTRILDIHPGEASSSPSRLAASGERVYFRRSLSASSDLWVTDGTPEGTRSLPVHLCTGADQVGAAAFDGLVFVARDERGCELWRTDGTVEGTGIVHDVHDPPSSSKPRPLGGVGRHLLFAADDGVSGHELWRTNGTAAGTRLLRDIHEGPEGGLRPNGDSAIEALVVAGTAYFPAADAEHGEELWRSDGTEGGTWLVHDVNPGSASASPQQLTHHDGALYFVGSRSAAGISRSVLRTDGTGAGTESILDFPTYAGQPGLVSFGGYLYVSFGFGTVGLWRSDGTAAGTEKLQLQDLVFANWMTPMGGQLLMAGVSNVSGEELWATDGTVAGTRMLQDIVVPGRPGENNSSDPRELTVVGDSLYFVASNLRRNLHSLWRSDGTVEGTVRVLSPGDSSSSAMGNLTALGGGIAFSAAGNRAIGNELWMIPPGGEAIVHDVHPDGSSLPGSLFVVDETLLFAAADGVHGRELWRSDGYKAPAMIADIEPGRHGSEPMRPTQVGNFIYFEATHSDFGTELWAVPLSDITGIAGSACDGDCDGDGTVTVDELTMGVSIALGHLPVSRCFAIDRDASGETTVDEIVEAIGNALFGCAPEDGG